MADEEFSPVAIGGILAAIAFLLLAVFITGWALRKHKMKRYQKRLEVATAASTTPRIRNSMETRSDGKSVRFEMERR